MRGIIAHVSKFANTPQKSQLAVWVSGLLIFFDDYANTLIVGNTLRPLSDKYKVSREKLAYIVDSTAAPIAAIAFITTWIGAELGYINDAIRDLGLETNAYSIFLSSLKYAYYPVLAIFFILILVLLKKDFGPMLRAERAAANADEVVEETENEIQPEGRFMWANAVIPIVVLVAAAFGALVYTGYSPEIWNREGDGFLVKLSETIGEADPYRALIWASFSSLIITLAITLGRRILSLEKSIEAMVEGVKTMFSAMIILVMAWVLADVISELNTAAFLSEIFAGNINPWFLPAIVFIVSAAVSFSTGSSWGTMAILYPLFLPVSFHLSQEAGLDLASSMEIFYHVTSVVLAGAVFGDHCSPISDTTILSSLSSSCNHMDHVRTQMPYALTVAGISLVFGHLAFVVPFFPWYLGFVVSGVVIWLVIKFVGK